MSAILSWITSSIAVCFLILVGGIVLTFIPLYAMIIVAHESIKDLFNDEEQGL